MGVRVLCTVRQDIHRRKVGWEGLCLFWHPLVHLGRLSESLWLQVVSYTGAKTALPAAPCWPVPNFPLLLSLLLSLQELFARASWPALDPNPSSQHSGSFCTTSSKV